MSGGCTGVTPNPVEGEAICFVKDTSGWWHARVYSVYAANCHVDLYKGTDPGGDPETLETNVHHISQGGIPYWCRSSELPASVQATPRFC